VGKALDMALTGLMPLLESAGAAQAGSAQRETVLAILNGVMGDHLVASGNPLAISDERYATRARHCAGTSSRARRIWPEQRPRCC
jgi:hypothetical protein